MNAARDIDILLAEYLSLWVFYRLRRHPWEELDVQKVASGYGLVPIVGWHKYYTHGSVLEIGVCLSVCLSVSLDNPGGERQASFWKHVQRKYNLQTIL